MIFADITLTNAIDLEDAKRHLLDKDEVRQITVSMMVDSGAFMMCINENIQEYLKLPVIGKRLMRLADDNPTDLDVAGPIMARFVNRWAMCDALVLPGDSEPLLGAIPMEEMDVLIHPQKQELIINPAHPDGAVLRL